MPKEGIPTITIHRGGILKGEHVITHEAAEKMNTAIKKLNAAGSPYGKYFRDVKHLDHIDVYRVLQLFGVLDPCVQHAVKKLLLAGSRTGKKPMEQDIEEAIVSLRRWQDMVKEDMTPDAIDNVDRPTPRAVPGARWPAPPKGDPRVLPPEPAGVPAVTPDHTAVMRQALEAMLPAMGAFAGTCEWHGPLSKAISDLRTALRDSHVPTQGTGERPAHWPPQHP